MGDETTNTKQDSNQLALDQANPNFLPDVLRGVKLGHFFSNVKAVFTGLASSATQDITTAAAKAAATISGITLDTGENLPAIGVVKTLRDAHSNIVVDAGGAAVASTATYPGTVLLSDDGKTLTFAAAVTAFTLEYQPRSAIDTQAVWSTDV